MSVKGMMQTVLVTELKQIQPDISDAALRYVVDNFSQMFDVREILAAQVEALREHASDAAGTLGFLSHHLRGRMREAALMQMAEIPQQHLAEIRAEAGRAGFVAGAGGFWHRDHDEYVPSEVRDAADHYAESIRRGEVE